MSDEQIRLPELPVFKRFSLALRQEYATASEILSMLDRTSSRIETILKKAEEESRKAEEPVDEEVEDLLPAVDEEDAELLPTEEGSRSASELLSDPGSGDRAEEVSALFDPVDFPDEDDEDLGPLLPPEPESDERESFSDLGGPLIPEDEEEVETLIPPDDDELTSLIGRNRTGSPKLNEDDRGKTPSSADRRPETKPTSRGSKAKAKPKPKRKKPTPSIVRVSEQGRPLKSSDEQKAKAKSRGVRGE